MSGETGREERREERREGRREGDRQRIYYWLLDLEIGLHGDGLGFSTYTHT